MRQRGDSPTRPRGRAARVLTGAIVALAAAVVVLLGVYVFAGELAPGGERGSIVVMALWFVAAVGAGFLVQRRVRFLRVPLATGIVGTIVVVTGILGYTAVTDRVVDEQVAMAGEVAPAGPPARFAEQPPAPDPARAPSPAPAVNVEVGAGSFRDLGHPTSGRASAIELAEGGRVLTLTDFETDNGPDLLVYLVAGEVDGNGDGEGFVDLGALKGNIGDQQYAIPDDVDLARYSSVVIWCRAFSSGFGVAELSPPGA